MRRILASLIAVFVCLMAMGQAFTPRRPFIPAAASTVNTNPESILPLGMKFWYKATDLSNSPVALWPDRIKGYNWAQATLGNRPTWDNCGVHFNGTDQSMDATNGQLILPSEPFLCVFQFERTNAGQMVICHSYSGGAILVGMGDTPDYLYGCGSSGNGMVGKIGTNTMDLIYAPKSSGEVWNYTNGFSGSTQTFCYDFVQVIGAGAGNGHFKGYLKEFIVWTNTLGPGATNYWTSTTVSNVHWYATNTWASSCVATQWTPAAMPSVFLWYKADAGVSVLGGTLTNGSFVDAVTNQGNFVYVNTNLIPCCTSNYGARYYLTNGPAGKPCLETLGIANSALHCDISVVPQLFPYAYFILFKLSGNGLAEDFFDAGQGGNVLGTYYSYHLASPSGTPFVQVGNAPHNAYFSPWGDATNSWTILSVVGTNDLTSNLYVRTNGVVAVNDSVINNFGGSGFYNPHIGGNLAGACCWSDVLYYEIICCNAYLTSNEVWMVQHYLENRRAGTQ